MGRSKRSGTAFGSSPTASYQNRKSRGQLIRERYSSDRYPTSEDFIRAVEENPEYFDPASDQFFPNDYGRKFSQTDKPGLRGVSGHNFNTPTSGKSNWIADNPIEVDASIDPGSLSVGVNVYSDDEGNTVSVVAGIDVVPLGIDINVNGDVGSIGVELGAPGDLFGIGAEVNFDTDTGEVIGGGANIELGGVDIGVDRTTHNGQTCTSITVTYFGIGASYRNCKKDDEEPKEPEPPSGDDGIEYPPVDTPPPLRGNETGWFCTLLTGKSWSKGYIVIYQGGSGTGQGYIAQSGDVSNSEGGKYPVSLWLDWMRSGPTLYKEKVKITKVVAYMGAYDYKNMRSVGRGIEISFIEHKDNQGWAGMVSPTFAECISPTNWYAPNYDTEDIKEHYIIYHTLSVHQTRSAQSLSIGGLSFFSNGAWFFNFYRAKYCELRDTPEPPPPPPPIPIPPEDDVTECCNLEPVMSLLRKVSEAIAKTNTVLDAEHFNVQMPQSVILKEDGQEVAPGVIQINNYAEFLSYLFQRDDERWGAFGITVKVEDTDPLTGGNQEKDFYLPNLAESIAEMYGILLQLAIDGQLQKHLAVKNLTEASKQAVSNTKNYYLLDAIVDYLGFKTGEKNIILPLLCKLAQDPQQEISMDEFITESEIPIKITEFKDDGTLQTTLAELKQAAAIIRALHYRKINPYGDIGSQIQEYVMSKSPDNEKVWEKFVDKLKDEFLPDGDPNKGKNDNGPTIEEVPNI